MSKRFDSEHPDVDDILGAYALDAVDPSEREVIERHLADDPVARAEVDEMRETAAALASLPADDEGAPAGLWDRIAGAIGVADAAPAPTGHPSDVAPLPANVVPITRAKRSFSARIVVPVVAAAALVIAVLGVQVATRPPSRAGDLAAAYNHAVANGAKTVALRAGNGVVAEIAVSRDGSGYLRNVHLAALPSGKTYQLWAVTGQGSAARIISAGVLGSDPSAVAFHLADQPNEFAITVESAPGVVASKNVPTAVGSFVT
jgi:anti-sigma-K factor RskA